MEGTKEGIMDDTVRVTEMDENSELPSSQNTVSRSSSNIRSRSASFSRSRPSSVKRKGSPSDTDALEDRRQNTDNPTKSKPKGPAKSKNIPFSELLLDTFMEKSFIEGFAPVIENLLCPFIKQAVEETARQNTKVLTELTESNKKLHDLKPVKMPCN